MLFSSITFLYYFLPLVILVYFVLPKCLKNTVLLVFSLLFYAWGEPKYVFLMTASIAVTYILGLTADKFRGRVWSKVSVGASVAFSVGALGYFKYADFFIENINSVTGFSIPFLRLALPIGISFYTFQTLSYVIDVYRGKVKAQKNPITLGTYVALFPQLIAGPIVRYCDVERQLRKRTHSFEKAALGIRRFVLGLSKKIILANTLGQLCEVFNASGDKSVAFYWLYVVSYTLQVYFDFSGYSDMAIGLGKIFGFDFMENFRYPFVSKSIAEFWRRWHISLGTWFRDYVYIPMGGNRVTRRRHILNIFVVWFLTGFWHGAQWNFIVWGLYFGVLLILEKHFLDSLLAKSRAMSHLYVIFLTLISFAIFGASNLAEALKTIGAMFGANSVPAFSGEFWYNLRNYGFTIFVAILCSTPLFRLGKKYVLSKKGLSRVFHVLELPCLAVLFMVATAYLVDGSFNPFLYFRF